MKNKFLLFVFGAFLFMMIPKTANAQVTSLIVFDSNFNRVQEQANPCYTTTPQNMIVAKYFRWTFDDSLAANTKYTISFNVSLARKDDYAWFRWSGGNGGVNTNGAYRITSPTSASTSSQSSIVMGNFTIYSKTSTLTFDFTNPSANSSWFFQIPTDAGYFQQICLNNYTVQQGSSQSSNADSQAIINNNNQNTQTIINNNNQNTQNIINSQNQTTEAIEDLNDTLQDTTIDDETLGDKVGDIETISETPITDLITMPLVLLNKLYTGMSGSCSTYTLGTLFNHTLTLPCFNGSQIFGSTVWTIIDGLFVIFMLYNIGMMVVQFFEKITSLHDTFDDMYIPQHAKGGGR